MHAELNSTVAQSVRVQRAPLRPDRASADIAEPDRDTAISFGMPYEPEDSQCEETRTKIRVVRLGVIRLTQ